jgi:hypothetical protein
MSPTPRRHPLQRAWESLLATAQELYAHATHTGQPPPAELLAILRRLVNYLDDHGAEADGLETELVAVVQVLDQLRLQLGLAPPPIPDVFDRDAAPIPTMHAVRALVGAIHAGSTARGWADQDGQTVPTHRTLTGRGRGAVYVSVRDTTGDATPATDVLPQLWEKVRALDDLTSDVLLVCLAHWATRSERPDQPVWITADAVLDARGIKRKRYRSEREMWAHGHRREDRLEVARAFARLDSLWLQLVNVEVIPPGRGRKRQPITHESKALAWLDRITQPDLDGGEPVFLAARVMPGSWASEYAALDVRQTGLLAKRALAYDPYRQQPEKRLAKYLAFHVRINSKHDRATLDLRVSTLLDTAGLTPEPAHPQRTRARLEAALDQLKQDCLLDGWRYVHDRAQLPARRWLDAWLGFTVALTPPTALREPYAALAATAQAAQALRQRRARSAAPAPQ